MRQSELSRRSRRETVARYVMAILWVALAFVLTRNLRSIYQGTPNSLFFCAIIFSAWRGGLGPAILASILSSGLIVLLLPPGAYGFDRPAAEIPRFAVFLFAGVFISWLTAKQKRTEAALRQARDHLEEQVAGRTKELATANEALRDSEAKLKEAQRIGRIGYWQRDLVADRVFWSEETAHIFGISQHEMGIPQAELEEFILPEDRELQRQALECAVQNGQPYDLEYRVTRPNAEVRFLHVRDELVRDASGRVVRLFGTVQDITERREAESALRENQEFLRVLTENANDLVRVHDLDGRGVYASPSVERLFGRKPARIFELAHPDESERCRQWWRRILAGSTERLQWRVRDRNGDWRWLQSVASHFDFKGKPHVLTVCRDVTESERAQDEIRTQKEHARQMLDAIPQQIWSGPSDGMLDYCNFQWRAYTGLSLDEVRGNGWQRMLHPDDRDRVLEAWEHSVRTGKDYEQEERHRRSDGVYCWFLCRAVPLRNAEGRIERWYGSNTDIEDRKRAEEALRRSEDELRLVIDTIPVMAWTVRPDGIVDFLSRRWMEYSGLSLEQYVADPIGPIHPNDVERVLERWRAQLKLGEAYEDEMRLRGADGQYRWFLVRTAPLRDEQRQIVKWYGVSTDIEDRKRAEEALKESQQLLQQVLATLPVGVAVTDQGGNIVLANAAVERIWGDMIVAGRARWAQSRGFWHESGKPIAPSDWASVRALTKGQTSLNELIDVETFDGQKKTILNSAAPIRNGGGEIIGAAIVNEDVTELKRNEEKLRETEAELARVARVTMMGELTTSIAHEVNQPLAAVVANANAAERWLAAIPPNLEEASEAVQRIARDGRRASAVVQRIRNLVKKSEPAATQINVNDLVEETHALTQPELKRKNVSFQIELSPGLPRVAGDRVQLQQVLLNLFMNAIDSLDAVVNRPRILGVRTQQADAGWVQVIVEDTGTGIKAQETERLFEPFYTTKPQGLGMGLAISRAIVEAHGGRLWAASNERGGATFQFILPAYEGAGP